MSLILTVELWVVGLAAEVGVKMCPICLHPTSRMCFPILSCPFRDYFLQSGWSTYSLPCDWPVFACDQMMNGVVMLQASDWPMLYEWGGNTLCCHGNSVTLQREWQGWGWCDGLICATWPYVGSQPAASHCRTHYTDSSKYRRCSSIIALHSLTVHAGWFTFGIHIDLIIQNNNQFHG